MTEFPAAATPPEELKVYPSKVVDGAVVAFGNEPMSAVCLENLLGKRLWLGFTESESERMRDVCIANEIDIRRYRRENVLEHDATPERNDPLEDEDE